MSAKVHHCFKHGKTKSSEYNRWSSMNQRCHNSKSRNYKNYGARGIFVCDRWRHSFVNFLADMGECPIGLTLDRIDNNGPYAPENCRWANYKVQGCNKRDNKWIEVFGEKMTIHNFNLKYNLTHRATTRRLNAGWTCEQIVEANQNKQKRLLHLPLILKSQLPIVYQMRRDGQSCKAIGNHFGVNKDYIKKILIEHGDQNLSGYLGQVRGEAFQQSVKKLRSAGLNQRQIAERLKCSAATIHRTLFGFKQTPGIEPLSNKRKRF